MATTVREYSLEYYLLERLRFVGFEKSNLEDIVSILASLKNKYGITPYAVLPYGDPIPNCLSSRYLIETVTLSKMINVLLDTPRLQALTILPRGIPRTNQFELKIAVGG